MQEPEIIGRPRPSYKLLYLRWRQVAIVLMAFLAVESWLLLMAVRANVELSREMADLEAFCNKNVTAVVK